MTTASLSSQTLARGLLSWEAARCSAGVERPMCVHAVQVCGTLRGALTTFAGTAGFRALLARALVLAKADSTVLASVQVREDGTLAGFDALVEGKDGSSSPCSCDGGPVLVAHLLDLLTALVGRSLTMRLVRDACPGAPAGSWNSLIEGTDNS